MTRPNITKGEWHNTNKPLIVQAEDETTGWVYTVADCSAGSQLYAEQVANSKAISALPDLLEALEKLTVAADAHDHWSTMDEVAAAKSALLKAGYTF